MLTALSVLAAVVFALILCAFDHFFTRLVEMKKRGDVDHLLAVMREINRLETASPNGKRGNA